MSVTAEDILERCEQLALETSAPVGIERVYLSPEHAAVNRLAASWMEAAGLRSWTDQAGNQRGRLEGATPGLPALLLGSHLDTVPNAGKYDGILGVMIAIAAVDRIRSRGILLPFAVEILAFGDEEGTRFGTALLGSRAVAGTWEESWWDLHDARGTSLREAFVEFGLDPAQVGAAAHSADEVVGYLEVHIEQGPYLEEADRALAVVSSIAGARRFALTLHGEAGHAGGVPFHRRHDALAGASELVLAIERLARDAGCIATVGRLQAFPGGVNVIPGRVDFSVDLRGETDAARDAVWAAFLDVVGDVCERRGLTLDVDETHSAPAVVASERLQDHVRAGIRTTGDADPMVLFSKAGHDAMAIADLTEWAMLFVRNGRGGISHHPDETVTLEDVAVALEAFEGAILAFASSSTA